MGYLGELAQALAYLKPGDLSCVEDAYRLADQAHAGQFRSSGDPYISHPVAVAEILSHWQLDAQAVTAALLHDVVEDTQVSTDEIFRRFGKSVADLVEGVSKLDRLEFQSAADAQAENFRKMLIAMARDVRVMLIKLADRLHNMRTLDAVPPAKRRRIARETMEIYAPIANRLGLDALYRELEELSFRYIYPLRHAVLAKTLKTARSTRRELVARVTESVRQQMDSAKIKTQIVGRERHLFSIYRQMLGQRKGFAQVLDVYAIHLVVDSIPDCYLALGAMHGLFKPVPGKFKDYIAIPKSNGYQSLHTTLIGPQGMPVEIQIRTRDMDRIAQTGVASHWLYKEGFGELTEVQARTTKWLQSLLEIQRTTGNPAEFLEHLKIDLFSEDIYLFTPKGRILSLPRAATPVDFAYAIHTDIGNRCVAAKVNNELAPLRSELKNGDRVEIVTAAHAHPNPIWLSYVKTGKARSQIRHFLKSMHDEESVALGERLLGQALRAHKSSVDLIPEEQWAKVLRATGVPSRTALYADIGLGTRLAAIVARELAAQSPLPGTDEHPLSVVTIDGSEGRAVQFARCCGPIPGDPIIGFIQKGQGLIVHTHDCRTARRTRTSPGRWVDVEWGVHEERLFEVQLRLVAANQPGVLAKVAAGIADSGSNIVDIKMDDERGIYTSMLFTLQVSNRMHLARVMKALRRIQAVVRISRVRE